MTQKREAGFSAISQKRIKLKMAYYSFLCSHDFLKQRIQLKTT